MKRVIEEIEGIIENSAIEQLRFLKTLFTEQGFDDRTATLFLAFYLNKFLQHGYKGNKPTNVIKNISEIIKETGGDNVIPFEFGGA